MTQQSTPREVGSNEELGASAEARDAAPHDDIGRAAMLVLSHEMLTELLQLPPGCHIDGVAAPHDQPGVLHLRVRGAGWPTKAGWLLPKVRGTVTRYYADNGSVLRQVIDWGLPHDEAPNDKIIGAARRPLEPTVRL